MAKKSSSNSHEWMVWPAIQPIHQWIDRFSVTINFVNIWIDCVRHFGVSKWKKMEKQSEKNQERTKMEKLHTWVRSMNEEWQTFITKLSTTNALCGGNVFVCVLCCAVCESECIPFSMGSVFILFVLFVIILSLVFVPISCLKYAHISFAGRTNEMINRLHEVHTALVSPSLSLWVEWVSDVCMCVGIDLSFSIAMHRASFQRLLEQSTGWQQEMNMTKCHSFQCRIG